MSDDETLEIVSDSDGDDYSCSSNDEDETCYYCNADLDYEDNEFYIEAKHCYCCERCWNEIHED
tara:strand:- start:767 stop:958 length:192 start_codon:yes stop_codon:yes gene_type:complete